MVEEGNDRDLAILCQHTLLLGVRYESFRRNEAGGEVVQPAGGSAHVQLATRSVLMLCACAMCICMCVCVCVMCLCVRMRVCLLEYRNSSCAPPTVAPWVS